jgi:hypothetical protein
MKKNKLPESFYNPITILGSTISTISFIVVLFLIFVEAVYNNSSPYMGIITFIIIPAFLIIGLILIAIGILIEKKRLKKTLLKRELPKIDLNNPRHFRAITIFGIGTVVLVVFTIFGGYKTYEFTESDEFCGTLCHKVMEPEYTAYKNSPHSRVGCVQCHIGSGAGWFVKSKISGVYQVYSVLLNKYSKPIQTPIENLRPAQETCEQCHWPKHFLSEKRVDYTYYLSDEQNTKSSISLLLKVGGGNSETGSTSGIHWHMNIANEVFYFAADKERQIIPWVKLKQPDGTITIFKNKEFSDSLIKEKNIRKVDCIECHNRPSHIYNQPDKMVNLFISVGKIDESLPFIKSISVKSLEGNYHSNSEALREIKNSVESFYSFNYPEISKSKVEAINQSTKTIQKIYLRNYFPYMKVSWGNFPNNIGHTTSYGCFRCHDGKHISNTGKTISNNCNVCHIIIKQELTPSSSKESLNGIEFSHPIEIGAKFVEQSCVNCHLKTRRD